MGTSMSQFSLDPNLIVDVYIDVDVDLCHEIFDVVDYIFVVFFVRRSCVTLLDHETSTIMEEFHSFALI